jgi:hypothetical protein
MAFKTVYRDYRKGHEGEFITRETYNRMRGQGIDVRTERVEIPDAETVTSVDDLFEYEDYPDDELFEYEFHATGDTGRGGE